MRRSFHDLALLAGALEAHDDGSVRAEELAKPLGRPQGQVLALLAQAEEQGLTVLQGEEWSLTPKGRAVGSALLSGLREAQLEARETFRPFTDYVPERWWPSPPRERRSDG